MFQTLNIQDYLTILHGFPVFFFVVPPHPFFGGFSHNWFSAIAWQLSLLVDVSQHMLDKANILNMLGGDTKWA